MTAFGFILVYLLIGMIVAGLMLKPLLRSITIVAIGEERYNKIKRKEIKATEDDESTMLGALVLGVGLTFFTVFCYPMTLIIYLVSKTGKKEASHNT